MRDQLTKLDFIGSWRFPFVAPLFINPVTAQATLEVVGALSVCPRRLPDAVLRVQTTSLPVGEHGLTAASAPAAWAVGPSGLSAQWQRSRRTRRISEDGLFPKKSSVIQLLGVGVCSCL